VEQIKWSIRKSSAEQLVRYRQQCLLDFSSETEITKFLGKKDDELQTTPIIFPLYLFVNFANKSNLRKFIDEMRGTGMQ
jgi:hypothetical protein